MAGKSRQMSPHAEGEKQAPITLIRQWKEILRGDRGGETASKESLRSGEMLTLRKNAKNANKPLRCPKEKEHEESWRMRISNKPLTVRVKLVLLVVNSVKLHLTALK